MMFGLSKLQTQEDLPIYIMYIYIDGARRAKGAKVNIIVRHDTYIKLLIWCSWASFGMYWRLPNARWKYGCNITLVWEWGMSYVYDREIFWAPSLALLVLSKDLDSPKLCLACAWINLNKWFTSLYNKALEIVTIGM